MAEKRASWATLLQTDPPTFGKAKMAPRWYMNLSVNRRRDKAKDIIARSAEICEFEPGVVSIMVLCCKRLDELTRLVESLRPFLQNVETHKKVETILVDNGSGPELVKAAEELKFFDRIIANEKNLGMAVALDEAYPQARGEYILLLEEDFIIDYPEPFMQRCLTLFDEFPEIGIIRLKNQRNWGKKYRIVGPARNTSDGTKFWTWLPSLNGKLNGWCAGSVLFRKVAFMSTGRIEAHTNVTRDNPKHQGAMYEEVYGKRFNKSWLAAKIYNCYPFVQPNDTPESPGWGEIT